MRTIRPFLVSFSCSVAGLLAQAPVVVPSMATTPDGDYSSLSLFFGNPSGSTAAHTQALYATADIGRVQTGIHSLAFRRATRQPGLSAAITVQVTIEMSVSPVAPNAASATFDANHGPDRTVVFQGPVTLPAAPGGPWPAPFETPIALPTPFAYDGTAGNSLVVDVVVRGNTAGQSWPAAACVIGYGTLNTELVQSSCLTSQGDPSGAFGYRQFQPYPGGTFSLSLLGYARKASFANSVMLLGFQGPGANWGGYTLPVPLVNLGIAANAPCQLAVTPDAVAPMTYIRGSSGNPGVIAYGPVVLPTQPVLTGMSFFTQALSIDFENAMPAPLVFPSLALRWTFGTGARPACSQVVRMGDTIPPAATGTVEADAAPVFALDLH